MRAVSACTYKLSFPILLEFFILTACATSTIQTTTFTVAPPSKTPTLISTQTATPSSSITLTPSLKPITGGWSTFYSYELGLSFQYPAVFDMGFQSLEFTCDISVEENSTNNLLVIIGDNRVTAEKTNKNLTDYTNQYIENKIPDWDVKKTEIEINGLDANRLEYYSQSSSRSGEVTILAAENKAITIEHVEMNFFYCDLQDDSYSSYWIYERIIETLKF